MDPDLLYYSRTTISKTGPCDLNRINTSIEVGAGPYMELLLPAQAHTLWNYIHHY